MKKVLLLIIICSMFFLVTSCKKKVVKTEPVKPAVKEVVEPTPKVEKPVLTEEEIFQQKSLDQINAEGHLSKVYFDFDKYSVKEDMKPVLQKNADWILKHSTVVVQVEGHCDERGTEEYNIALGEKRAKSVKKYLESLGVPAERLSIISYGKSKPCVKGINEETYSQNRRDEFKIIKK